MLLTARLQSLARSELELEWAVLADSESEYIQLFLTDPAERHGHGSKSCRVTAPMVRGPLVMSMPVASGPGAAMCKHTELRVLQVASAASGWVADSQADPESGYRD